MEQNGATGAVELRRRVMQCVERPGFPVHKTLNCFQKLQEPLEPWEGEPREPNKAY